MGFVLSVFVPYLFPFIVPVVLRDDGISWVMFTDLFHIEVNISVSGE